MMEMMILGAVVAAEAVALAGLATLVLRLRARLGALARSARPQVGPTAAQMSALIDEAHDLSADLTRRLTEQTRLVESFIARSEAQMTTLAEETPVQRATTRKSPAKASTPAAATAPVGRSRAAKAASAAPQQQAEEPTIGADDLAAARQLGMDPLGVAIQRGLRRPVATA